MTIRLVQRGQNDETSTTRLAQRDRHNKAGTTRPQQGPDIESGTLRPAGGDPDGLGNEAQMARPVGTRTSELQDPDEKARMKRLGQ